MKTLKIILGAVLAMMVLSACGSNSGSKSTPATNACSTQVRYDQYGRLVNGCTTNGTNGSLWNNPYGQTGVGYGGYGGGCAQYAMTCQQQGGYGYVPAQMDGYCYCVPQY